MQGILLTPIRQIPNDSGDILHAVKQSDPGFKKFGEAYFSSCHYGNVKAWSLHKKMTLNVVVPIGAIRFVVFDDRKNSATQDTFFEIHLSKENYFRLTVSPGLWVGFQGISKKENILLNIADIEHDRNEMVKKKVSCIDFNWELEI